LSIFSSWFGNPIDDYLEAFKQACEEEEIPIRVTSVRRSSAEQDALYAQGRTEPGPIVTWTRSSAHVDGRAFDITLQGAPEYEHDPETWDLLGAIGQDLGLKWGGSFGDFGHFELKG
jgi:peptidoglycan L-alanyl-D-glutamate endopeptidase CwlK